MATGDDDGRSLTQAIGLGLRNHREANAMTREDLSRMLRGNGLNWSTQTLAAVETGTRPIGVAELVAVSIITGADPVELLKGEGSVSLTPTMRVDLSAARNILGGHPSAWSDEEVETVSVDQVIAAISKLVENVEEAKKRSIQEAVDLFAEGEAEQKAARKLGCRVGDVTACALDLWGRSLTEERDARASKRAGPDASPSELRAVRGHVTRDLLEQIRDRMSIIAADH